MEITLKQVDELYNVIKVLKFEGVPVALRLQIIRLMRQLKPYALRIQDDVRDAIERFKPEHFDEDDERISRIVGKDLTEEQKRLYFAHQAAQQQIGKQVDEFLLGSYKDGKRIGGIYHEKVNIEFEPFSDTMINKIIECNVGLDAEKCVILMELIEYE